MAAAAELWVPLRMTYICELSHFWSLFVPYKLFSTSV